MKENITFRTVLTFLAIFLSGISQTVAQTYEKTFSFEFLTKYIQIERNGGVDCIIVDDIIYNNSFWGDYGSKPALPYIHYTILLPDDYKVKGFTFSKDDTWTADNIILRPIPSVVPISVSESADDENNPITYPITTYPAEIILIDENISYGYRTAKILINPFTYYAETQKLELATSLSLTVTIEPIDKENTWIPPKKPQEIKRDVYNLEDIDKGLENWTKEANKIESTAKGIHLQVNGSSILCTSPTAMKFEVYTMDAVKVGEASFINGEAVVKVNKTPATYLYIVTYPDGRRESGKVVVK